MEKNGTITIQVDHRGELIYVEMDGRRLTEPTHNLYDNLPPGSLKGIINVGKVYIYEQSNCTQRRCVPLPNGGVI